MHSSGFSQRIKTWKMKVGGGGGGIKVIKKLGSITN